VRETGSQATWSMIGESATAASRRYVSVIRDELSLALSEQQHIETMCWKESIG